MKIRRNGCDELHAAVMAGSLTMNLGLKVAKFDHVGQRLILAEFPTVKPRDRAGFVEIVRLTLEQEKANG